MTIKDIQMPTLKCVKKAEEVWIFNGAFPAKKIQSIVRKASCTHATSNA